MKRQIIEIDDEKCDGCGLCVKGCPEGALRIIDGKAKLVGELLCDGLGACLGECPRGAIVVTEREAAPYDEKTVMENIVKGGPALIDAHLRHLRDHDQTDYLNQANDFLKAKNIAVGETIMEKHTETHSGGCPGSKTLDFSDSPGPKSEHAGDAGPAQLRQWPVQLHLINPHAPYFRDADLLIAADCVPFAYANFHQRFLKGKALVIFCPKLDDAMDAYVEKLTTLLTDNNIKSITVLHMEVPCCFGLVHVAEEAVKRSGKTILMKDYNLSLRGELI